MKRFLLFIENNFTLWGVGAFWIFAVMNPVLKKYDNGSGWRLVIVFGVLVLLFGVVNWRKKREKSLMEGLGLLLFILAMFFSFLFSQVQNLGLSELIAFSSVSILYMILAHQKISFVRGFLRIVLTVSSLSVFLGFFLYFFRDEPRMIGPFFSTVYHSHIWPNAFALFLLMVWPVGLLIDKKHLKWKIGFLVLLLSALLLTFSRGAFIVFGGQLFLLALYFWRVLFRNFGKILLVLVAVSSVFLASNYLRGLQYETINVEEKIQFANEEGLTSKQERIDFWKGSIELTKEKPWFGWGPFSFRYAYNGIQKTFLGNSDHPHNVFLKIATENGVIALLGFLIFLFSLFILAIRRFSGLTKEKKDFVYILGVAVAGTFAHNLIDYNLNFFGNLLLLFLYLAMIRSFLIKKVESKKPVFLLFFAVLIAFISFYEGSVLVFAHVKGESYLEKSFFPNSYYLNHADNAIARGYFTDAIQNIDKQIAINKLDSQAWYLRGVVFCKREYVDFDLLLCKESFEKSLELNPMNEIMYYRDYLRVLSRLSMEKQDANFDDFILEAREILEIYFIYVDKNIHFTAYTSNVEAAAELVELLVPYLGSSEAEDMLEKRVEMLEKATVFRANKTF